MFPERVQKIIASRGYCSRRKAEELIAQGIVKVNGERIKLGDSALQSDRITIDGEPLKKQQKIYIMLNKPKGYECTLNPETKSVLRLIPLNERIYPVGRLDKMSCGLLLLTNDGDFANKVMHPSNNIDKIYLAELDIPFLEKDFETLQKGIRLMDGKLYPKLTQVNARLVKVKIHEGRKHVIKRMFFKLGYFVKKLTRVQVGQLQLDIKEGKWRFLTEKDKQKIFMR
jgi:23S rRNA pseudouridine2605 synthase